MKEGGSQMKYENAIFKCIDYIEKHIKEELTAEKIAKEVGYSVYHFSRIFKDEMGSSLMEYTKERRLVCASKELFQGKKIIDVAVEYGYQTHSGFTKAFKRKFDFTPTLIHAIRMSCELLNEGGGQYIVENSNVFIKQSVDFKQAEELYEELLMNIKSRGMTQSVNNIEKAYDMAKCAHQGEKRKSGEDYIIHPLNVAIILTEMEASEACIIAGLLHEVCEKDTLITLEEVMSEFSLEVARLIEGVEKFKKEDINDVDELGKEIILIKLADRLHNMRTIKYMEPERFKDKAKETIEIFSSIAVKLGVSKIKTELDDLSIKYL